MEREDKKAKADKVIEHCMAHGDSLGEAMVHTDSYLQAEQVDTREKLEADVNHMVKEHGLYWLHTYIIEWLDRQAAITTHEVIDSYEHKAERQSDRIFELHNKLADALEQVDNLTAERDDLAHELRRARKAAKRWHELASGYRDKAAQFVEIIETLTATLDRKNARIKRLRGKLKRARNK